MVFCGLPAGRSCFRELWFSGDWEAEACEGRVPPLEHGVRLFDTMTREMRELQPADGKVFGFY